MSDRPDWHAQTLIKGSYGGTLIPIAVDAAGNLLALIQGDYLGTPITVQTDVNGLIKVNLTVQDLNYMKMRPVYGQRRFDSFGDTLASSSAWTDVFSIAGRGAVIGGWIGFTAGFNANAQYYAMDVDGATIVENSPDVFYTDNLIHDANYPLSSLYYDPVGKTFILMIGTAITFETSFVLAAHQDSGSPQYLGSEIYYALVP